MTKEYLKMADMFTLPVKDEDRKSAVEVFSRMVSAPYSVDYTVALSQYAAHAIDSHDELVAEVERLREFDRDAAMQRKLEKMADQAMTQMYKQARSEDKRAKVTSAMQTMLFTMLRKLDNDALNNIINNARDGCVPLNIIPLTTAAKLMVVIPPLVWLT